jgi:hypothetical protein
MRKRRSSERARKRRRVSSIFKRLLCSFFGIALFFLFLVSLPPTTTHLRRVLHEPALVDVSEELVGLGILDALGDGL